MPGCAVYHFEGTNNHRTFQLNVLTIPHTYTTLTQLPYMLNIYVAFSLMMCGNRKIKKLYDFFYREI